MKGWRRKKTKKKRRKKEEKKKKKKKRVERVEFWSFAGETSIRPFKQATVLLPFAFCRRPDCLLACPLCPLKPSTHPSPTHPSINPFNPLSYPSSLTAFARGIISASLGVIPPFIQHHPQLPPTFPIAILFRPSSPPSLTSMLRPSDLVDLTDSYPNSVDLCSSPPSPGAPSTPATARFPHHHSRAMIQSPSTQDDDTTAAVGLGFGDVQYGAFRDRQGKNLSRHQLDSDSHRRQIQPTTCLVPSGSPPRTASSSTTSNQNPSRSDVSSSSRLHPIKTNIPYFVSSVPTTHPRPTQEPKSDASYVNSSDPLRDLAISLAPPSSPSIHHHPTNQSNDTPRLKRPLDSAPEQDSPMRSPFTPSLIVSHPNSASPSDRVDVSAHVSRQGSQVHRSVPARETTITEDDIDAVEEKLDSMSLEWGLEDEEGDDESEEMQALRSLYGLVSFS